MKKIELNKNIKISSIAVYVLALMLVTGGYWAYISRESQTIETVNVSENSENSDRDEHLGDATLVSNNELIDEEDDKNDENSDETEENKNDYFQESKLSRDTMYSQTLEVYKDMLNNPNVSEEQKSIITQEIAKLNKEKNSIMICENLISTKGFDNCVVFVNVDSISVIIQAEELSKEEIAQIQNIISREMSADINNIHIMKR